MEHLPKIRNARELGIEVSYLGCKAPSIGRGFWTYPEDHGWNTTPLIDTIKFGAYLALANAKKDRSVVHPTEFAALLQGWWYFGMLSEVLGTEIEISDFTKWNTLGKVLITTENLETHLQKWKARLEVLPQDEARKHLESATKCVNYVHKNLQTLGERVEHHCKDQDNRNQKAPWRSPLKGLIRRGANGKISVADEVFSFIRDRYRGEAEQSEVQEAPSPAANSCSSKINISLERFELSEAEMWTLNGRKLLPEDLELSIGILGFTLSHAMKLVSLKLKLVSNDSVIHTGWYCPQVLERRMIADGFCPRAIHRLRPTMLLIGTYLSSQLQFHTREPSHSACTASTCTSDHMVDSNYTRCHAETDCSCKDLLDASVSARVQSILKDGGIPVLRLIVSSASEKIDIEVLPADPERPYVAFSHVWSDGLGNPDSNELYECQWRRLQHLADQIFPVDYRRVSNFFWVDTVCVPRPEVNLQARRSAISRMRKTYYEADKVLVLDSHLLSLPAETTSLEFSLRLSWSKWMRRLWTMHEGAIARVGRTFVQLGPRVVRLAQESSSMMQKVADDQSNNSEVILSSLGAVEAISSWRKCLEIRLHNDQHTFMFVWNETKDRGTKYEADRYVVVCSLLRLEAQATLEMSDTEEKMKFIFKGVAEIPSNLLFAKFERFEEEAWRWAPTSLGKESDRIDLLPPLPAAKLHERGLLVSFEGWLLSSTLDLDRRFEWTGKWTKILERSNTTGTSAWIVELSYPGEPSKLYSINLRATDHPALETTRRLAVVLQPKVNPESTIGKGVLVSMIEEKDNVTYARFEASIWMLGIAKEEIEIVQSLIRLNQVQLIKASRMGDETNMRQWCIG
ncbi:hypothetical protein BDZ45DRAFT_733208 [Acephala macrosclerotiorum]|nr:hypothetical protein BDZ45DRAFT_733208 [Acephala macrosclerotiorum]